MLRTLPFVSLVLASLLPLMAQAEPRLPPQAPMAFSTEKVCSGKQCKMVLLGEGNLEEGTPELLVASMRQVLNQDLPVETVVLHSRGGDLAAGLKLGTLFRTIGLSTQVVDDGVCASSCAYAFIGGRTRTLSPNGYLGVHRFSPAGADPGADSSQLVVNTLTNYVESMGVSTNLIRLAAQADPTSLRRVTTAQAYQLNVDNTQRDAPAWTIQTNHDELDLMLRNTSIGNDREAVVNLRQADGRTLVAAVFQEPLVFSQAITNVELAGQAKASICRVHSQASRTCVKGKALMGWKREAADRRYGTLFEFSSRDLTMLTEGSDEDQIWVVVGSEDLTSVILLLPSSAKGFRTAWRAVTRTD